MLEEEEFEEEVQEEDSDDEKLNLDLIRNYMSATMVLGYNLYRSIEELRKIVEKKTKEQTPAVVGSLKEEINELKESVKKIERWFYYLVIIVSVLIVINIVATILLRVF